MAMAGGIRDGVMGVMNDGSTAVVSGASSAAGFLVTYALAIVGLFVLLVVLGPLAARSRAEVRQVPFGIAEFPA
jgi:preprotein translocase subunit SecG